jgi:phenylacetate-coenzyme A ligase PaaK-like adenylate-forming protein
MRWARLFDEQAETMPAAWLRRLEEERLDAQLERIGGSPAYPPASAHGLAGVELVTGAEHAAAQRRLPPFGHGLCADPVDVVRVVVAGGSAGAPAVAYTARDLGVAATVGARCLWAAGIRPDDRVLDLLTTAGPEPVEKTGAAAVVSTGSTAADVLDLWPRIAPSVLLASAGTAVELEDEARRRGESPRPLALTGLALTGDLDETERSRLEDVWGARVVRVWGHPLICDLIAAECERRDGLHALAHGVVLVELLDDAGAVVPLTPGASGEAVLTHLDRDATPLLRLRSGLTITVLAGQCPCGRTGPRFKPSAA